MALESSVGIVTIGIAIVLNGTWSRAASPPYTISPTSLRVTISTVGILTLAIPTEHSGAI